MAFQLNENTQQGLVPRVAYPDGVLHHVISEGARFHVDRMIAAQIAQKAGQIEMKRIRSLMSEDIY